MSIRLMSIVWRMELGSTDKMVLLALADAANDDGVTWLPMSGKAGKQGLRQKTSLSERCIQTCLKRLVEAGHLAREERTGRGVLYQVLLGQEVTPAPDAPPHVVRPAPDAGTPAPDAPKPSLNHQPSQKASPSSKGHGTRLAAEFIVPDDWRAWARAERHWAEADVATEAAAFVDYWHAKPGKDGRKADWAATWRNWVRNSRRAGEEPQSPMVRALLDREAQRAGWLEQSTSELRRQLDFNEHHDRGNREWAEEIRSILRDREQRTGATRPVGQLIEGTVLEAGAAF